LENDSPISGLKYLSFSITFPPTFSNEMWIVGNWIRSECVRLRCAAFTSDSEKSSVTGVCGKRELVTRNEGLSFGGVSSRIGMNFFAAV